MQKPMLNVNKETRKLWRLQTAEKYTINKLNDVSFEVFSKDLMFKAFVNTMGVLIFAKDDNNYNKVEFYKLQNLCSLLQKCHWGI